MAKTPEKPPKTVPLGPALTAQQLAAEIGDGSDTKNLDSAKERFRKNAPAQFKKLLDTRPETS